MSLLADIRIRYKIIIPLLMTCMTATAGLAVVAWKHKTDADAYASSIMDGENARLSINGISTNLLQLVTETNLIWIPGAKPANDPNILRLEQEIDSSFAKADLSLPSLSRQLQALKGEASKIVRQASEARRLAKVARVPESTLLRIGLQEPLAAIMQGLNRLDDKVRLGAEAKAASLGESALSTMITALTAASLVMALSFFLALFLAERGIMQPLQMLSRRMVALTNGDTEEAVEGLSRKDEFGEIAIAVEMFRHNTIVRNELEKDASLDRERAEEERRERDQARRRIAADTQTAIASLGDALERMAGGDVSFRLNTCFSDELDQLRLNFNNSAEKLMLSLSAVGENASTINNSAAEVRVATDDLARRTSSQAAFVEQTAAALHQITRTVAESTSRAERAGNLVERTLLGAEKSGTVVKRTVDAIHDIEHSSGQIANILGVIDEIAFQTNLLALNAGVEAARAGSAGRGFAVVAQEVRELAQRSAKAAKEIKVLITTSSGQVKAGVSLINETGKALDVIVSEVQEISAHVGAIVEAAREQATALTEINHAVISMDQGIQQNVAMVEETSAASLSLASEASALAMTLSEFKLGKGQSKPGRSKPGVGYPKALAS